MTPARGDTDDDRANAECDPNDDSANGSEFVASARTVPESVRRLVSGVHDDRGLGVLCEIDARNGVAVRELLDGELCESDLHGLCSELRAAGLLETCEVAGERGYRTTGTAHEALSRLRG